MSQRHLLREGAAHRDAGQLSAPPPERVQHPDRIGGQVRAGVPRRPGRVADRLPRIAVVVPDDEAPALALTAGQPLAEFLLPPVHRGAHAPDEQDRGISPVARGVHAQVDAVDLDDPRAVHNVAGRYRTFTADLGSPSPTRCRRTGSPPGLSYSRMPWPSRTGRMWRSISSISPSSSS